MIEYLKGLLVQIEPSFMIVDCNGIGYGLKIALSTYDEFRNRLHQEVQVFTYLQIREDAHILYGFSNEEEKKIFLMFLSISGIGGNTALTILSGLSVQEIYKALEQQNVTAFKSIKGVGEKTAQRIILELKDKFSSLKSINVLEKVNEQEKLKIDAVQGLVNMGLKKQEVEKRVEELLKQGINKIDEIIRGVLKLNKK
ncbi:MAG: Holliday junction ATP-dependent DNA helicase RuvA [Bacteroidia bacterium]|jgi:Holliday junction DNA helicase RuvA|nr:MAG: Holliday junction ATP-dependent DNA helicase RuvA [Bacteroidia bacterium]